MIHYSAQCLAGLKMADEKWVRGETLSLSLSLSSLFLSLSLSLLKHPRVAIQHDFLDCFVAPNLQNGDFFRHVLVCCL